MVEGLMTALKIAIRLAFGVIAVMFFTTLYFTTFSTIQIALQQSIISDLFALFQIWLPFNLSTITLWMFGIVTVIIGYRMAIKAIDFIKDIIGFA